MDKIQTDFDRLAVLSTDGWDHNRHYHPFLLRHMPARCEKALDIGCGTGAFSRLLAQRAQHVLALDLSSQMIRLARERSIDFGNIEYQVADVLKTDLPSNHFDCIVSIATLHHLPFEALLEKMKSALRPGGVLLVLDLFKAESIADFALSIPAIPWNFALRLWKEHRLRPPSEVRAAWAEHGRTDAYLTLAQVRQGCVRILPGACITRHLLWRYSIVWIRPLQHDATP
ncbi:MAG: methyltransferase domain-containing protein [Anaerolineae bacterium]